MEIRDGHSSIGAVRRRKDRQSFNDHKIVTGHLDTDGYCTFARPSRNKRDAVDFA